MLFHRLDYQVFLALAVVGYWSLRRLELERDPAGRGTTGDGPYRERAAPRGVPSAWLTAPRFAFVVLASCVFYSAWEVRYLGLILFSTALDYSVGRGLGATRSPRLRRMLLGVSLAGNLGLLGLFKYFNFFGEATADVLAVFGVDVDPPVLDVLLPVGISFYTFQTLSYTIDVYRGRLEPTRNPLKFAFYVTFFPQLVAGPVVRAAEFLPQLDRPPWLSRSRVSDGLFLIAMGLVKKVIFADFISVNLVDRVFDDPSAFTAVEVVIALYGFTLQIYADFSGYTDVARGSGLLFGIELPENFDRPYQARSVAEFWRRWHMTLSTWLRDYLYFPLGGSRGGTARTYFNLWLTIFLIGLWHGASWTFVVYGNLQAFAVMSNRALVRWRRRNGWGGTDPAWVNVLKVLLTLQFVVFSRILFRATDLDNAYAVTAQLFTGTVSTAQVSLDVWRVLVLGFFLHYVPRSQVSLLRRAFVDMPAWAQGLVLALIGATLTLFSTQAVVPYIYFQF
ncbi:MAG: MBOAT family O-acyltransferase [Sandaracinaceae bacterium]